MEGQRKTRTRGFLVYTKIYVLYPKRYRRTFGRQMQLAASDMLKGTDSGVERFAVWAQLVLDLPRSICREHYVNLSETMNACDGQQFRKLFISITTLTALSFIFVLGSDVLAQIGYLRSSVGSLVLFLAVSLSFIAALLIHAALHQPRSQEQASYRKKRHKLLVTVRIFSLTMLLLALMSLLLSPQFRPV